MHVFFGNAVWSTPNLYFGKRICHRAQTRILFFWDIIGNAFCRVASRLRKTHTCKKMHFPSRVSSTPNAHSKNWVSSRLRQMPFVLQKGRLVYTKRSFREANPSRGEPSPAEPLGGDQGWLIARSQKTAFAKKIASRLHQTLIFPVSIFWAVVNARDTRFCFAAVPSNLRLVYVKQTFSQNCIFQRPSRVHRMHILKIKCRLAYTKCPLFLKNVVSSTQNTYLVQRIRNWAQMRMLFFFEIIRDTLY